MAAMWGTDWAKETELGDKQVVLRAQVKGDYEHVTVL